MCRNKPWWTWRTSSRARAVAARNMHMVGKAQRPVEVVHNEKCVHDALGHVIKNRCAEKDEFEAIDAHNIERIAVVQNAWKTD